MMRVAVAVALILAAAVPAQAQLITRGSGYPVLEYQAAVWTPGKCVMSTAGNDIDLDDCPSAGGATPTPQPTATLVPTATPAPTALPDCSNVGETWFDAAGSGTRTATCSAMKLDAAGTVTLPDAQELRWATDTCFERSSSGVVTISTDCAGTRARLIVADVSVGRTTTPQGKLSIEGTNGSYTAGPHVNLYVNTVTDGPIMQLYGNASAPSILFGQFWNGATAGLAGTSTNATANFQIVQVGDKLSFAGKAGVALGGAVVNQGIMLIDATNAAFSVGSGSAVAKITRILAGSATLDFPSMAAGNASDLTVTVTNAADGDVCMVGVPNAAIVSDVQWTCWVSATNTVTVRAQNSSGGARNPASGSYKVTVIQQI